MSNRRKRQPKKTPTRRTKARVAHFVIFSKTRFFAITSRLLRIPTEHIEIKNSLDSKLQTFSIYSIRIRNILEVIARTRFFKNRKMRNPGQGRLSSRWSGWCCPRRSDFNCHLVHDQFLLLVLYLLVSVWRFE